MALGQHTRSYDVGRGIPSSPLGSIGGWTTLGVTSYFQPWTPNTMGGRRAWHAIIALG